MITEHLMRPGSGSIRFRRTLPRSISKQIMDMINGAGCHLVITPIRLNPADLLDDSVLLGAAMSTLRVVGRPSRRELALTGIGSWLDTVPETVVSRTSGTPTQWLGDLLRNGLSTGTVSGGSNVTRSFGAYAQTYREALDTVATLGSWEYDIRPDFTVDAGSPANIFQSPPRVVITQRAEGHDGALLGLSASLLDQAIDASQQATKAVAIGQGSGTAAPVASASQSIPLKTWSGGTPAIVVAIDAPSEAEAQLSAAASAKLAAAKIAANIRVAPGIRAQVATVGTPAVRNPPTGGGGLFTTGPGSGARVDTSPTVVRRGPLNGGIIGGNGGTKPTRSPTGSPTPSGVGDKQRLELLQTAADAMASARRIAAGAAKGFLALRRSSASPSTGTDSDLTRRLIRAGDEVWVYDLESGLHDSTQEIVYRGETISPQLLRVLSITWPCSPRYGYFIRSNAATPTIIDVSAHVEAETGGAFLDVGNRPAGSYSLGSRSNPALEQRLAGEKLSTYTPTLSGMVVGTGGSNSASWRYANGVLVVWGFIAFGTSGQTFPGATITVSLPSGFTADVSPIRPVGAARLSDSGTGYTMEVRTHSTTELRFVAQLASGTYVQPAGTSTTVPFTWGASDEINWQAVVPGTF